MYLIRGARVVGLSPTSSLEKLSKGSHGDVAVDVLIGGGKILKVFLREQTHDLRDTWDKMEVEVIEGNGHFLVPGFVDIHVHVTGGGGELGPASRCPESQFTELVDCGITTLVGLLGTDSISRSLENLHTKLLALESDGLATFMWSGGYRVPVPTLTESVQMEMVIIPKVIGFGEIAIADHRSSNPSFEELARLVADVRVGGMLGGKSGKTYFHMGKGKQMMSQLWEILEKTEIPITQMLPTHMSSRGPALLEEGKKWVQQGGFVDFTADSLLDGEHETIDAILDYKKEGVDLSHVMVSSDAYGSMPVFDEKNENVIGYDYGRATTILETVQTLVLKNGWTLAEAIQFSTRNPSQYLLFKSKGFIGEGFDADLLLLDETTLEIKFVIAKGTLLKSPTYQKQSMFSRPPARSKK